MSRSANIDLETVEGFGREWATFDQRRLSNDEYLMRSFDDYFALFHFNEKDEGFDLGCGSGRWAKMVAPRVAKLHCIDPAEQALSVARANLADRPNVEFHHATSDTMPIADGSQDFGYSLGVLHHIPDPESAMRDCVRKIKPGGQFLVYLYYRFDNRPRWFHALWRTSDLVRRAISKMPFRAKKLITDVAAAGIYFPLARLARTIERTGRNVDAFPLSAYRASSFYSMRTDALDRFGTRLEHRFTRAEIEAMMRRCGLEDIRFGDQSPYWVAHARKPRG